MNDCKNANDEIFVNGELTTAENTATNEETSSAELLATEIAASVETHTVELPVIAKAATNGETSELPPQPAKEGEFNEERFVRASLIEAGLERAEEEPQPPQYDEETLLTTILMTIGINPASHGFACFKRAIRLFLDGKTRMGEVHKVLAKEFGRTAMAIERNMRMTLVSAHSRGRLITFNSLVLIDAVDERYGITPKEFIATAAEYVKNDYLRDEVLIPNLTRRLKSLSVKYSEGEKE